MRIRAGIVLIQNGRVALIERYRAGLHYFIFPGGGVDEGELPEQAAVREAMEELGIEIAIKRKVAEVHLGYKSRQFYFLVEQTGGEFGTGRGEEFESSNLDDPQKGMYIPIWMPVEEVPQHTNIYPAEVAELTVCAAQEGWPPEPVVMFEKPK
jgi:8-oxo-dGTP pyrophosphatase MutT (NUDIX family)